MVILLLLLSPVLAAVCPVRGEEGALVRLLGRPGDPVVGGPRHWSAHLPALPGERAALLM